MKRWLRNILGLVILVFLIIYLATHWDQLEALLNLTAGQLAAMYALTVLTGVLGSLAVQRLLRALKTKTRFWDMFYLHNAALLLNYVPMKFGTLFRANYLKRHYGLAYTHFASFFMYITFLMTATAAGIGFVVLAAIYGLRGYENKILAAVFAATVALSLTMLWVPLPVPKATGRVGTMLRGFLLSRGQITRDKGTILTAAALLVLNFVVFAVRIGIIYRSMGKDLHPLGYLILGALGFVTLFIGVTPGSLGIKEVVLASGAAVLGIPLEVGILAAVIDRAIDISYLFVVGGTCASYLWRKSPADFKERQAAGLTEP